MKIGEFRTKEDAVAFCAGFLRPSIDTKWQRNTDGIDTVFVLPRDIEKNAELRFYGDKRNAEVTLFNTSYDADGGYSFYLSELYENDWINHILGKVWSNHWHILFIYELQLLYPKEILCPHQNCL